MKELLKLEVKAVSGGGLSWVYGVAQVVGGIGFIALGAAGMFPLLAEGNLDYIVRRNGVVDNVRHEGSVKVIELRNEEFHFKANKPFCAYSPALANILLTAGIAFVVGGIVSFTTSIIYKN